MVITVAVVLMTAINDGVGHETLQSKQIQFGSKWENTEKKKKKNQRDWSRKNKELIQGRHGVSQGSVMETSSMEEEGEKEEGDGEEEEQEGDGEGEGEGIGEEDGEREREEKEEY